MNPSPEQLRSYADRGYVVFEDAISGDEIAVLRDAIVELVGEGRKLEASNEYYKLEDYRDKSGQAVPRNIWNLEQLNPIFEKLMKSSEMLDPIAGLIGPNIEFHHMKANLKLPGNPDSGADYEWHQDYAFWPHTNTDFMFSTLYLDDSAVENGCLMLVPGSHHWGPLKHVGGRNLSKYGEDLLRKKSVYVEANSGSLLAHHPLIVHSSGKNSSARPRRSILTMYRAADARQLFAPIKTTEPKRLVRGRYPGVIRVQGMMVEDPKSDIDRISLLYDGRLRIDLATRLLSTEMTSVTGSD